MGAPRWVWLFGAPSLVLASGVAALSVQTSAREPVQIVLPAPSATPGQLTVHVVGAVQAPGAYQLAAGDRIDDAMRAAGGPAQNADLSQINLAARLRDGAQVTIPARGERLPGGAVGAPRTNINTADQQVLEALPGIGAVRARRIVESRESDGAFIDAAELVERRIVTASLYERLRDLIATR
ncbi:MAG: ComEA family DNA-binding protein [Dehalococcoidia bacterium]|nr:ComEA family DNA-binding protein [Dehalococcoidia bacterium]